MPSRRMAGPFSILHDDTRKIHKKLPSIYARDLYISLFDFNIYEKWDEPGNWVTGTFEAKKSDIIRNADIKKATFFRIAWPQLLDSGLVIDNEDGTITITMLKKKKAEKLKEHSILNEIRQLINMYAKINEQINTKINELYKANLLNTSEESTTETLFDANPLSDNEKSITQTKNGVEVPKESTTETNSKKKESTTETMEGQKSTTYTKESTGYTPTSFKVQEEEISLSLIDLFYVHIGQKKISKEKRERALKSLEEIKTDGFSDDDIEFAVKWTIENAKEKPYDFSIIKHTISQAMAVREEYEEKEKRKSEQEAEKAQQEKEKQKIEERSEYFRAVKEKMSVKERERLVSRAFQLANERNMKQEFLTESAIESLENEILEKDGIHNSH